jgi:hypothetical protein
MATTIVKTTHTIKDIGLVAISRAWMLSVQPTPHRVMRHIETPTPPSHHLTISAEKETSNQIRSALIRNKFGVRIRGITTTHLVARLKIIFLRL